MKRNRMLLVLVCFFGIVLIIISCKKDHKEDTPQTNVTSDSLVIVKTNFSEKDTLQDIVKDAETNLDLYFYGKRNSDAKISRFTSMIIKNRNAPDTLLNIVFDDSSRIKAYYSSVKGVNDSSLYTIGYNEHGDSIFVCRYLVDWSTGTRILRRQAKLKKSGDKYAVAGFSNFRMMEEPMADKDALRQYLANASVIAGTVILVIGGGLAGTGVCGPICGLAAALGIASILLDGIHSANASELPPGTPLNIDGQQIFVTTATDILQSHTWRYESRFNNGASDLSPCDLDNFFTFGRNGTLTENTNVNQCFLGEPNIYAYSWSLYNNDQSLRIADPAGVGGYVNLTITKLTLDRVELSGNDDLGESWQYVFKTF